MKRCFFGLLSLLISDSIFAATDWKPVLREAFPKFKLEEPVDLQFSGEGDFWVLEQRGRVRTQTKKILDINDRVLFGGEQGLLGLAFHPKFKANKKFYLNYMTGDPRKTLISEFVYADTEKPTSERVLLVIEQPYSNHNGGPIFFGPDGMLYIGLGDGGARDDPRGNAQNLEALLGKFLRIDVDTKTGSLPYGIPKDNPFVGQKTARAEIYAFGIRNPWGAYFDFETKTLWSADVGQDHYEEINQIRSGKNYGWPLFEGRRCYLGGPACSKAKSEAPVAEYERSRGGSITGGVLVPKKSKHPWAGRYVFADFVSSHLGLLTTESGEIAWSTNSGHAFSAIRWDPFQNRVLGLSYSSGKIIEISDR